jgi:hypothetical protein
VARMPSEKAWPGTEKKPQVERREARFLDRKRKPHASQACWAARRPLEGLRMPLRFSALRSPRFWGSEGTAAWLGRETRRETADGCLRFESG